MFTFGFCNDVTSLNCLGLSDIFFNHNFTKIYFIFCRTSINTFVTPYTKIAVYTLSYYLHSRTWLSVGIKSKMSRNNGQGVPMAGSDKRLPQEWARPACTSVQSSYDYALWLSAGQFEIFSLIPLILWMNSSTNVSWTSPFKKIQQV
jgi:hypothetical protein